jgi:hypothetical protein
MITIQMIIKIDSEFAKRKMGLTKWNIIRRQIYSLHHVAFNLKENKKGEKERLLTGIYGVEVVLEDPPSSLSIC